MKPRYATRGSKGPPSNPYTETDGGNEETANNPFVEVRSKRANNRKKPSGTNEPTQNEPLEDSRIWKLASNNDKNSKFNQTFTRQSDSEPSRGPDDSSDEELGFKDSSAGLFTMEAGRALQENMANLNATLAAVIKDLSDKSMAQKAAIKKGINAQEVKNKEYEAFLMSMNSMHTKTHPSGEEELDVYQKTAKIIQPKKQPSTLVTAPKSRKKLTRIKIPKLIQKADSESDHDSIASQDQDDHYQDLLEAKDIAQKHAEVEAAKFRATARASRITHPSTKVSSLYTHNRSDRVYLEPNKNLSLPHPQNIYPLFASTFRTI